jgi:hypothetical protein
MSLASFWKILLNEKSKPMVLNCLEVLWEETRWVRIRTEILRGVEV